MRTPLVVLALSLLLGAGPCQTSPATSGTTTASSSHRTVGSAVAALRSAGFQVKEADAISQPFFTASGRVLVVEGDDLQVYDYATSVAAAADAAKISPSGSPIGTSMPSWMRPPHIYHKDNLILIYLGDSARVRSVLEAQAGPQIAGAR